MAAEAKVRVLVNVIPGSAKFVTYAQMRLNGPPIVDGQAGPVGEMLSKQVDQLATLARQKGGNLIVLLSSEHGVAVPISQCERPIILARENPTMTAIVFAWDASAAISEKEERVHFVINAPEPDPPKINYTIGLKVDTAGVTKAYWAYGNISRFVNDAVRHDLDTVSLRSSQDSQCDEVWLPSCDGPLRISLSKPELTVTVFKSKGPDRSTRPTPAPAAGQPAP